MFRDIIAKAASFFIRFASFQETYQKKHYVDSFIVAMILNFSPAESYSSNVLRIMNISKIYLPLLLNKKTGDNVKAADWCSAQSNVLCEARSFNRPISPEGVTDIAGR